MNILVYGTGGVGGYFGSKLAQAGNKVTFVARGKHLDAIQKNGLQLKSIEGNYTVFPVNAVNDVSKLHDLFDVIIVGTKSWQVKNAAENIKKVVSENTLVLPLQNGVSNVENLLSHLPKKNVLAGMCKIYAKIEDYGIINHFAFKPEVYFGEITNEKSSRVLSLKKQFENAGIYTIVPEDIYVEIWNKFLFILTVSGLGALTRVPIGVMFQDDEVRELMRKTLQEAYRVGIAKGINLSENTVENILNFIGKQSYNSTASTQRDIMEGRPSELENFNGYIVEEGKKLGVSTPVNAFIYQCLLPQEKMARGLI